MSCGNCHYKDLTPVRQETAGSFVREIASYFDGPVLILWYEGRATVMAGNRVLARCNDVDDALWGAVKYVRNIHLQLGDLANVSELSR